MNYTIPGATECDEVTTYYKASDWCGTIGFEHEPDAIQISCPGCNTEHPDLPAMYHRIHYAGGEDIGFSFFNSEEGLMRFGDLGIVGFVGSKLEYTGDGTYFGWNYLEADEAGSAPASLGSVNGDLMDVVMAHTFGLPCCGVIESLAPRPAASSAEPPRVRMVHDVTKISVYPNPANNMLYFRFPLSGKTAIRLMDISGRVINEQEVVNGSGASVNVKDYAPGMYIYQVITSGKTKSGKIMIEK